VKNLFFQKIPVIWFVANVGGILGLTMGCSLVTIFEVLHHIILMFLRTSAKGVSRDQCYKKFPSLLMMRPNELEHLSMETLSRQVLEFEGKARANPIGAPFSCFLVG